MSDIASVLTRLQVSDTGAQMIAAAADMQTATERGAARTPCVYIIPGAEPSGENRAMNTKVAQLVTVGIIVLIAIAGTRDPAGSHGLVGLSRMRSAIMTALLNFQPVTSAGAIQFESSTLHRLDADAGLIWWRDEYAYKEYRRSM